MNYVSPPIEQYLKFKNHCSLLGSAMIRHISVHTPFKNQSSAPGALSWVMVKYMNSYVQGWSKKLCFLLAKYFDFFFEKFRKAILFFYIIWILYICYAKKLLSICRIYRKCAKVPIPERLSACFLKRKHFTVLYGTVCISM